jgi:GDP-4-dehydro-6-deoxy-D-mannose reductase
MGKLLLTGASGFVGGFVQQVMPCVPLERGGQIVDLRDAASTNDAIRSIRPDAVIHLAAQTFVPQSFSDPRETFDINFLGTFNLLSALKQSKFAGRFLLVSSSDVYGLVHPATLPVTETALPRPRSPYAVSKVAAEALCFQWSQTEGFEIVIARPFNHIGPGQRPDFVISGFAKQIAEIKRGRHPTVVEVGDIDVTRDFSDVRDVVRAYQLLLNQGKPGETYNVCSGVECSVRSLLNQLLSRAGVKADIRQDPARLRPSEQRRIYGSAQKLNADVGWQPTHSIEQTLDDILDYWEKQIA